MTERGCIRCKHQDENGEFNVSDKNCANCLLYGNFIGFEEKESDIDCISEDVNKRNKNAVKTATIVMRVMFFAIIASLILLLFFRTTYFAILTHAILIILLVTMLIRFLLDDEDYSGR